MPRYDLNGDPMPDDAPAQAPSPTAPQSGQYDLNGNPLPAQSAPPQPVGAASGQPSRTPSTYGAPVYPPTPSTPQQPAAPRKPSTYFDGKQFRFTDEKPEDPGKTAGKLAIAGVIALLASIFGSIGIMKILSSSGFGFTLLYLALGWIVGMILGMATPKKLAAIGVACAVLAVGLVVGHVAFVQDIMAKYPDTYGGQSVTTALPTVLGSLKGIHWLLVLLSFVACLRGAATNYGIEN